MEGKEIIKPAKEFLQSRYPQMQGEKWNSHDVINDDWIASEMTAYAENVQAEREELQIELAAMIGAIEHLSIGASTKEIKLFFYQQGQDKPTIIHPDKVNGIYEGVRQEMINMMGFGRKAVESHYKLPIIESKLATLQSELEKAKKEKAELNEMLDNYEAKLTDSKLKHGHDSIMLEKARELFKYLLSVNGIVHESDADKVYAFLNEGKK